MLNNIQGREHQKMYDTVKGQSYAIFDISEKQLTSAANSDWAAMKVDDLVCVVQDTYKMSTLFKIDEIETQTVSEDDQDPYLVHVVRGNVVAKIIDEMHYSKFLALFPIDHLRLKRNKFSIGCKVADLAKQLDSARIKTGKDESTIGELQEGSEAE